MLNLSQTTTKKATPIKTKNAKRVLQLMDSEDDGDSRYQEFVALVSKETGVSIEQLEQELDPFI